MKDLWREWRCTFVLVAVLFLLLFFILMPQMQLVKNHIVFWFLVVILMLLSFFSSACEAGMARSADSPEVREKLSEEKQKMAVAVATIQEKLTNGDLDESDREKINTIFKRSDKFKVKSRALNGTDRDIYVGALATFSVFSNLALAAFLPYTLLSGVDAPKGLVSIDLPAIKLFSYSESDGLIVNHVWKTYDLTSVSMFVFAASTIPILIFGKLIPKILGFNYPMSFGYRLYWFSRVTYIMFGWVATAVRRPFTKLEAIIRPKKSS